jgi:translocation and assembly module TamA
MHKLFVLTGQLLLILILVLLLSACSDRPLALLPNALFREQDLNSTPKLVKQDPAGPVPLPNIPETLRQKATQYNEFRAASGSERPELDVKTKYIYRVEVIAPNAPEIEAPFRSVSLLEQLKDSPPESLTGLDMRVKADLENIREVLDSLGYFDGTAHYRYILHDDEPQENQPQEKKQGQDTLRKNITVQIRFRPGTRYTLSKSSIVYTDAEAVFNKGKRTSRDSGRGSGRMDKLTSLADAGLPAGSFAAADNILKAVEEAQVILHENGYPFAEITNTRYIADYENKTLEAAITMETGPLCYMGPLMVTGEYNVDLEYVEALRTWRTGRIWRDSSLDRFNSVLRESGLFQTVDLKPAKNPDDHNLLPVELELSPAPERTVSGSLNYSSDFGAGVQASWTHRNLTGQGDRFSIDMPLWQDMQILFAQYRLPFVWDNSQDFVAQAALRNENIDAYNLSSISAAGGIERRFSRRLSGSLKISGEGGRMETPDDEEKTDYFMFGLPAGLTYNNSNNFMNASSGFKVTTLLSPYSGSYKDDFTVLRWRIDLTAYLPLLPGRGDDKLVLALRASTGSVIGESADNIPATIRFYSGGGGSVRGYAYQSLGPRNKNNDPLGGASLAEFSAESRWKSDQDWGLVAFIDGGMVYNGSSPQLSKELRWGAGLGLRYYTVIGPVRFDVATPVNGRSDDAMLQFYISIGQSF